MVTRLSKQIARPEDVRELVAQFMTSSSAWDEKLATTVPDAMRVAPNSSSAPTVDEDLSENFLELIIEALQDEIVPVIESYNGRVREAEVEREIAKKALVGLRLAGLKRLAKEYDLKVSGSSEELAERIAKRVGWNEEEIARLIVENADEVSPEQGYSTRIFPIDGDLDFTFIRERLNYVVGRYIRTGVARWFVFRDFEAKKESATISGALETLAAGVNNVMGKAPSLTAKPKIDAVLLSLDDTGLVEVKGGGLTAARGGIAALSTACRVQPLGYLRGIDPAARAPRGEFHSASLFLLSLLEQGFPHAGIDESHVTVARFRVKKESEEPWDAERPVRPRLKAVRLEGDYLFDSSSACRLLAVERRPLTDVTVQVTTRDGEGRIDGRFPMRIAIERDHVAVETSFGYGKQDKSRLLHEAAVQAVRAELSGLPSGSDALADVISQIEARAAATDDEDD